jgi:hypothetical protein
MRVFIGLFLMALMVVSAGCSWRAFDGQIGYEYSMAFKPITAGESKSRFDTKDLREFRFGKVQAPVTTASDDQGS